MSTLNSGLRVFLAVVMMGAPCAAFAQSAAQKQAPPPVTFTAQQDHQNMMDQLGIKALRPGPSGDENAPNHANYDESKANPYPNLPGVLTLNDGRKVTTPEMWWKQRRPEIVEDFEREVYGRIPKHTPKVTWTVAVTDHEYVGFTPVIAKRLIGHVDNSACPQINVDIQMTLVTPANAKGPVPVLMMFGQSLLPNPTQPPVEDVEKINAKLKELLSKDDPEIAEIFRKYPGYDPVPPKPFALPLRLNPGEDRPPHEELLADGWGYAMIDPASIQADNGAGLTRGIIGLVNHGQPRRPDDWGSLRAWEWGAARGLDYLETDPAVDAKHVGIEGVSRYGKAALVTLAFEPRFYMGLIGSSGKGGTTLLRRNFGEAVESLASWGEYHWMAGNFLKYATVSMTSSSAKPLNPGDLPVDSHELIALCAPRLVFISYGIPAQGDARWLDHQGSFMAAVAAGPVFRLLGAKDLGIGDDYHTAQMPPVLHGLLDGDLAWRQHNGGHTDAPNVKYFIEWADGKMGRSTSLR